MKRFRNWAAVLLVLLLLLSACSRPPRSGGTTDGGTVTGLSADAAAIAQERGLSAKDVEAALKTYTPSGKYDEAVMFASGGHSGQVIAIGVPSMRILKNIAVFTPESWQGYGLGEGTEILAGGRVEGRDIRWGDTHHPNISETNGEYDGEYLFINDKMNGRVAVIDLKDWKTKQIVKNPLINGDHGGSFLTPNTEYVIEPSQYAMPLAGTQADIAEYKEKYHGWITLWKFDREKGRIDPSQSFAIQVPPYWQDLCDAGKGPSHGMAFCNSFNTELATGKVRPEDPYFEAGTAARDRDYLHVIDWQKAEQIAKDPSKTTTLNGMKVIPRDVAAAEDIVVFVPEPKSPHGADVVPKGTHVVVAGKLDPHVSVYSIEKIKQAIAAKNYEGKDEYGFNIIRFEDALEAQVEVGLGPLHTVFDDQGYAYTSLFLSSAVARWSLGSERPQDGWKLIQQLPVHYNIGHLTALEGDTAKPGGKYLVALNKWSIDRFLTTGPLLPQNLQLVDISKPGEGMEILYDMAMGIGEPHYAQIIKADRLKSWETYPEVGWDANTQSPSEFAVKPGEERVVRTGPNEVHVYMTAIRSHFTPEHVEVKKGDHVYWHITNLDKVKDATHGFGLTGHNVALSIEPGQTVSFEFVADKAGTYNWYCLEFCSALHLEMMGYLQVKE